MSQPDQPPGESRFRALFETMALGVVYQDRDGRIIDANPAACEILGLTMDEIMGRTSLDPRWKARRDDGSPFFGEDHPSIVALRTGKEVRDTIMGVYDPRRDETRWLLVSAVPQFAPGESEPFQVYSTFNDITERRRMEEALLVSEKNYREIFNATTEAIFLHDASTGAILDVNRPMLEMYGYDLDEVLHLSVEDFSAGSAPYDQQAAELLILRAYEEGPQCFEWLARGKAGNTFWVEVTLKQIELGGKDRILAVVRDISERKCAEQALKESEERHRTLFESAGNAIFLMRGATFIDCNPVAEKMFGRSRDEMIGNTPMKYSPETQPDGRDSTEKASELVDRAMAGEILAFEWAHSRPDGTPFDAEVTLNRLEIAGEILLLANCRDITEGKKLEERLALAQKMETVGQLAGGVAHDFNNLLAPILGYSELLLAETDPDDPRSQELAEIRNAAERARTLTRQLLALSRKQVLEVKAHNLNDIVGGLRKMLRRTIPENIEIRVMADPCLGLVLADINQIEQVLMNLAINAADAMAESGTMTIETSNIEPEPALFESHPELAPGPYVLLTVSDTGSGMDDETLNRIFEPFFTTKEKGKGTGLGLSSVYGIIHQHRGMVFARSAPGEGSRFEVYLPRVEADGKAREEFEKAAVRESGTETIVVVEDNRMVRDLTCRILRGHGYDVLEAGSGVECIQMLEHREEPVDLLLTDVVMPGMNGKQLYEALAENWPTLRVLYMSGYPNEVIASHGVLEEGVQLIQKPFSVRELTKRLRDILHR